MGASSERARVEKVPRLSSVNNTAVNNTAVNNTAVNNTVDGNKTHHPVGFTVTATASKHAAIDVCATVELALFGPKTYFPA